jgi:putative hydrolase of HD superfamily
MNANALSYLFHRVGRLNLKILSFFLSLSRNLLCLNFFLSTFSSSARHKVSYSSKLLKMAVLHDLAEVQAGDITPHDGISREEKRKMEEEGLRKLLGDIPDANIYLDLWLEYEAQESKEAKIMREIDKLEMALTAVEYQKMSAEKDLYEFIQEADSQIESPEIRLLLKEVKTMNVL